MAFLKKSEYAKLCGLTTSNITTYVKRGKVIMSGDLIDDADPNNKSFLEYRNSINAEKAPPVTLARAGVTESTDNITTTPPEKKKPNTRSTSETVEQQSLFKVQKRAATDKLHIETKLKTLEYNRKLAKLIPTELMSSIIQELGKSFISTYRDGADQFLTQISHKKKLKVKEQAELKGELIDIINDAHSKAIELAKQSMRSVVDELVRNQTKT